MGVPFGVRTRDLEAELQRRERRHRRHMAPRLARLKRLQQTRAELEEYARLLAGEAAHLEAQQQSLLRQLAAGPQDPSQAISALHQIIEQYRQQQRDLLEAVMCLIAPYLTQTETLHRTRGTTVWPRVRPEERTGSGAQ